MRITRRVVYRFWQFWKAITAISLTINEENELSLVLNPEQMALFLRQDNPSQRHGYRVFKKLQKEGHNNHELLQAALLHDIGKSRIKCYWWDRPLVVTAKAISADRVEVWGKGEPKGWKRPFVIKEMHAAWGAELAELAGCSSETVRLIRQHENPIAIAEDDSDDHLLSLLTWADEQS